MEKQKNEHVTKTEMARRHIQSIILSGSVGPGDRITTRGVSVDLGISETSIREAIRSFVSDSWLEVQNHSGAVVQGLRSDQIREISALRGRVSDLVIELGADEFNSERLDKIDENIREYTEAIDSKNYLLVAETNYLFHRLLTENSKSPWCCRLLDNMYGLMSAQRHGIQPQHLRLAEALKEHRRIRDMLRKGDFLAAAEMVKRHERNTGDFLIKVIEELPSGGRGDPDTSFAASNPVTAEKEN